MRVVRAIRFGGPEVLVAGDEPEPDVAPGRLTIGVSAIEVLFLDTQLRSGWGREYFPLVPPYVPGTAVGGTVIAVGAGVDPDWEGRRVVAKTGNTGGYVQRAAVPTGDVFEVPPGVDPDEALAALHDGPTALSRLEQAAVRPGEWVLVTAAAGSLGAWLIPLARAAGARVVAAARGEQKLTRAKAFGADIVVDYSEPDWAERVREATDGVDVVFDGAGGAIGGTAFGLTSPGARFFSYGAASGGFAEFDSSEAERRGVTVVPVTDQISPEDLRRLTEHGLTLIADGEVRPMIGQTVPLERAAEAHAAIEARDVLGKTILRV